MDRSSHLIDILSIDDLLQCFILEKKPICSIYHCPNVSSSQELRDKDFMNEKKRACIL